MWLYIPTSCRSVPEAVDSTSASDWRAKALAQSVTWKGKHSRWQTWSQRFKRVSWTMLLFGAISPPSTAQLGVERWIGSLAASRVSPTATLDHGLAKPMSGICGQTQPESSERYIQGLFFSKTSKASKPSIGSEFGLSYKRWVIQLARDYSRREKLALANEDDGFSLWPTPIASDGQKESKSHGFATIMGVPALKLSGAARRWPINPGVNSPHQVAYFRLAKTILLNGHECSDVTRKLNPGFVEWMMGWPPGWTFLPLEHTSTACWATEWSHWWRLMRSELLRLGRG